LYEIQTRYDNENIYTYIGDILIALNPYRLLPIYGEEKWQLYREVSVRSSLPPHIYVISDSAYQSMRFNHVDQCCVVSGESGAGKTESTKLLIEHIAQLCRHDKSDLHSRIVQVNPLLEAFGNAQTVINNNS
jgi:myosin-3